MNNIKTFNKQNYVLLKKVIDPSLADIITEYLFLKRRVADTLIRSRLISPYASEWGQFGDKQIPNSYNSYCDLLCELLLVKLQEFVEKNTGLKLSPTYSYTRIYSKGDELKKHTDRIDCEISATLNVGGDMWPIFMKDKKINLDIGDMVIYKGCDIEHWREPFKGEICTQIFFHYNTEETAKRLNKYFDGRETIGVPFKPFINK
jgi:hypothetical protein